MRIDAWRSAYLAVADLEAAGRPYERLGLRLTPAPNGRQVLHVGGFALHFLTATSCEGPLREALSAGRALVAVGLRVADLHAAVCRLASKGVQATTFHDLAWLPLYERAGTNIVLVGGNQDDAALSHAFPLRRLDHLAVVTHDLEAPTRFWADVLGVGVSGEVATPAMVIRQLRIGDVVLELLGPASEDSPIWQRSLGLVGMASWEVADLDEAVRLARAAGLTVADPTTGVLPGTRIATIPGTELAGVNMQLLQYL